MRDILCNNTVTLQISGRGFEKFANECKDMGIVLSDISRDKEHFLCSMSFGDFKKVRPAARDSGVRIRIKRKKGTLYFLSLRKRRYGFYAGAILAAALFAYLTSCIWVVDVIGNDTTPTYEILQVMEKNGIHPAAFRYGKKLSDIKNSSLIDLDTLSWLWVTIDGTRAIVEVREKGESVDIVDSSKPQNLVASFAGVVEDMQIKSGRKVIERGMTVKKGQLLVSGVTETQYRANRYIASRGTVTARTWRTMEGEYHHTRETPIETGNVKKYRRVELFGKNINLYTKKKIPFDNYETKKITKQAKLFKNFYLPLSFTTEQFCEIIIRRDKIDDATVVSEAVEFLTAQIEKTRAKDAVTLKRTYSYEALPNGNTKVIVTLESRENIAQPVEIEVETTEDGTFGKNN